MVGHALRLTGSIDDEAFIEIQDEMARLTRSRRDSSPALLLLGMILRPLRHALATRNEPAFDVLRPLRRDT